MLFTVYIKKILIKLIYKRFSFSQILTPSRMASLSLLRGVAPHTVRTLSADTGTHESPTPT